MKTINCMIVISISLSGMGFCGHSHHTLAYDYMVISVNDHHTHCEESDHDEPLTCRCSCLGGFIGDVINLDFMIYFPKTIITVLSTSSYQPPDIIGIYHPPAIL